MRDPQRTVGLISASLILMMGLANPIVAVDVPRVDPLAGALAVLKIHDPRLLDREATQFAAGLGIDPAPMRAGLARVLFRSRDLEGIDLSRPALMAWRKDNPPLLAIIPLSNRRAFLDSFGASFGEESPLIRVSERDGTVVYTQNGNEGLLEYRLLVSDRAAYLGRNINECRALVEHQLPAVTTEGTLVFRANADYFRQISSELNAGKDDEQYTKGLAAFGSSLTHLQSVVVASWKAFLGQINTVELSVRPDRDGNFKLSLSVQAQEESQLSVWISNQRNQPSRLLSVVRSPNALFTLAGNIVWQGQAEQVGQVIMPVVREQVGDRWTPMVEENWISLWRIADRSGPFAMASDIDIVNKLPVGESRFISDQPRAQEMLSLIMLISQAITGRVGEVVSAGSATGYRDRQADTDSAIVANDRYLMSIQSNMRSAVAAATEVAERSSQIGAPEGSVGIVMTTMNFTPYVRALVLLLGGDQQPSLPQAVMDITVKSGLPGQLILEGTFPAGSLAQLLRDSGLMQLLR